LSVEIAQHPNLSTMVDDLVEDVQSQVERAHPHEPTPTNGKRPVPTGTVKTGNAIPPSSIVSGEKRRNSVCMTGEVDRLRQKHPVTEPRIREPT
jgi:hypothetical protein